MANVIKHKRGSGSDPAANNLVLGELAIRTDNGKLFTKMDSGAIAEIAGGGSDIAINTLSSSSATGGGSATFNGSAYRFTLSSPPSVSAAQLLVSVNGVIQKPVAGTGQPSEGFSVSGNDIIFGDAPATGADFFILTFRSLGVSEPADNSVTSAKIVDGAIVNADINASAAIAGSKISPIFTSATEVQNSTFKITDSNPEILLAVPSGGLDSRIINDGSGNLIIGHGVNSDTPTERLRIKSDGTVGIGTTDFTTVGSPDKNFVVGSTTNAQEVATTLNVIEGTNNRRVKFFLDDDNGVFGIDSTASTGVAPFVVRMAQSEKLRIDQSGRVGIRNTSMSSFNGGGDDLVIGNATDGQDAGITLYSHSSDNGSIFFNDTADTGLTGLIQYRHSEDAMRFITATAERMRINSSGNVLVGLSSTLSSNNAKLQVAHTDGNADIIVHRAGNNANPPSLNFQKTRNASIGNYSTIVQSGDELGSIRWGGADGSNIGFAARIVGAVDGTPGANDMPGRIQFHTSVDGSEGMTERMRIDSTGSVMIGTTSDSGVSTDADDLIIGSIGDSTNRGITLATSGEAAIRWADAGDNAMGRIEYSNSNDNMTLHTTNAERMRIDSSGNVKIGTGNLNLDANQNISHKVQIGDVSNDNFTSIGHEIASNSGDPIRGFVAQNNNGGIIENLQGSINQFLFLGDTDYQQSDKTLLGVSTNSGSTYYKRLDLSGTGILTIANGIKFNNDTAEANKLDDYEEGTFSPAIRPNSNSNAASMTVHEANYTRIGRLVHVVAYITINSNPSGTTGGDTRIVGLPFQNIGAHGAANIHYFAGLGNNINFITGTVQGNSTEILIRATTSATTGTSNIAYADYFGGNDAIIFSATYQAA